MKNTVVARSPPSQVSPAQGGERQQGEECNNHNLSRHHDVYEGSPQPLPVFTIARDQQSSTSVQLHAVYVFCHSSYSFAPRKLTSALILFWLSVACITGSALHLPISSDTQQTIYDLSMITINPPQLIKKKSCTHCVHTTWSKFA